MRLSVRLTLAMTALVLCAVAAVGVLAYYNIGRAVVPAELARLAGQAKARLGAFDSILRVLHSEILAARTLPAHQGVIRAVRNGGVDPQDNLTTAYWLLHLGEAYAGQMRVKSSIAQFSLVGIADGGRELLRVDRAGPAGAIRVVPAAELDRIGDHEAFERTIALPPGQDVHVSPIRAGPSQGGDALPVPMISISTLLRTPAGEPFGILVLDFDLRPTFERIRAALDNSTTVYFVDAGGRYLLDLLEGRVRPSGQTGRWQDDYPDLAKALGDKPGTATVLTAPDGRRVAAAIVTAKLVGGLGVGVIETENFSKIIAPATALENTSITVALVAALVAVLLSALLSRSLARPVAQITAAVDDFTRTGRIAVPEGLSGETRTLAAAFAHMTAEIDATTAALRAKSEQLDKIIASMADALAVIDADGQRVFANPPCIALFGEAAEIGSEKWKRKYKRFKADGVTPMPDDESPSSRARRGESFDNVDLGIRHADDQPLIQLVASSRPIDNPDGSFGGAVIVYRDITALKEAERQLRQAQKMQVIGQLTGGVAHDLNNILTVLTGGVEILADGVSDHPTLKDVALMVDQAVTRASDLTHGLLSFARKQPLQPRSIDVNALMQETARLLRATLGGDIEVAFDPEPDLRRALADPSQLSSALINLAINARDAMPRGGRLRLAAANADLDQVYADQHDEVAAGRYVVLSVTDTGIGIPAAIRDRVFEPFFTTKAVGEGTGLGLSMVYGFVKQSDGHIEICSDQGVGTTVRLYLPCAAAQDDVGDADAPRRAQGGRETILVVEDDLLVRSYVMTDLAALGYTAHAAATAAQAMALVYDELEFDLLFTDVRLSGGIDGRQLAETLRKHRPHLKVLLTSGYKAGTPRQPGGPEDGVLMLEKPYRRAELARMLRLALDGEAAAQASDGEVRLRGR
ncbi:ATP-binding protein [Rhodopseudomonas palustris]|uniref:ATP-binding protein n=1 Tax=Rhodopseudomonas palustris TaxID=1076 RepID=UPI002ACE6965|nr:ATP-binding protein [Rhodopseudomonas palustris]WQG98350.1 ATP-binding protein [Rhodopseudomonas palustris]